MTERISITEGRKILRDQATHREIQSAVEEYLIAQRIPFASTDAAEAFNRKGQRIRRVTPDWPDLTGCLPQTGVLLAVEIKAGKDKLRPGQARTLYALFMAGAIVCVARSVDDLIETLKSGQRIRLCDYDEIYRYKDKIQKRRTK